MVLMLLGMVVLCVQSASNLSDYVRENICFSALLSDDMRETDIMKLQKRLDEKPYIKSTTYISKEQALREEVEAMGTDPQEFIGHNPFTASIEINLHASYANTDSIARISKEIGEMAKVVEMVYPEELIEAVNRNVRRISLVLLGIAALLTLISAALINNTIRLTIHDRRFAIHTMKLVGAEWSFIRRPFMVRNFWVGFISALCANGLLVTAGQWLVSQEPELTSVITTRTMLTVITAVLVFGVSITLLCAHISVGKYLRMRQDALYCA